MRIFTTIIDQGSLSAAATALDRSPAAIARGLADLERHLGVRLLNRNTRNLALTDEGKEFLFRARRILADVEEAEHTLDAKRRSPDGNLRISAPVTFGSLHLAPVVNAFMRQHPQIQVELVLLDRLVDIVEEGFDLAIRIGELADSNLVARPLGKVKTLVCASPMLLEQFGEPSTPADLKDLPAAVFSPQGKHWAFRENNYKTLQTVRPVFRSNQIGAVLQAGIEGIGVVQLLSYQVAQAIEHGQLIRLLKNFEAPSIPVQFVYPHHRLVSHRVRGFMDWSVGHLSQRLLTANNVI